MLPMKAATHHMAAVIGAPMVFTLASGGEAAFGLACAAAFVAGGRAPDYLELPVWIWQRRYSVVSHRTLTHTWWVWLVAMLAVYVASSDVKLPILFACFAASALLHIVMDSFTPMGVPLKWPFGGRTQVPAGPLRYDAVFLLVWLGINAVALRLLWTQHAY